MGIGEIQGVSTAAALNSVQAPQSIVEAVAVDENSSLSDFTGVFEDLNTEISNPQATQAQVTANLAKVPQVFQALDKNLAVNAQTQALEEKYQAPLQALGYAHLCDLIQDFQNGKLKSEADLALLKQVQADVQGSELGDLFAAADRLQGTVHHLTEDKRKPVQAAAKLAESAGKKYFKKHTLARALGEWSRLSFNTDIPQPKIFAAQHAAQKSGDYHPGFAITQLDATAFALAMTERASEDSKANKTEQSEKSSHTHASEKFHEAVVAEFNDLQLDLAAYQAQAEARARTEWVA